MNLLYTISSCIWCNMYKWSFLFRDYNASCNGTIVFLAKVNTLLAIIGKIDKIFIDRKTNYYTINIRLFNDMTSLGYVYIIENKKKKEKQQLEAITTAPKK